MTKLALSSRRVLLDHGFADTTIIVENGIISDITDNMVNPQDLEIIDHGNSVIMPGIIDSHVHINEPCL